MPPKFPGILISQSSYGIFSWLFSLLVVLVCTTWSCVTFKKNVIASSDELNRRIISLPIVLPITLMLPSIISSTLFFFIQETLTLIKTDNLPYWILVNRILIFLVHQIISGIGYPCLLLHLNPQIQKYWKELVVPRRCVNRNQVLPGPITTGDATVATSSGPNYFFNSAQLNNSN